MRKFRVTVNGQTFFVDVEEQPAISRRPLTPLLVVPPPQAAAPAAGPPVYPRPALGGAEDPFVPGRKNTAAAPPRSGGGQPVTAPMPGVINALRVKEGDQVAEGNVLLILEAMKMENEITAPAAGVVRLVTAQVGRSVSAGETLMVIG